jgi:GWxTD domain-containing protein
MVLNESWNTTAPLPSPAEFKRKSLVRVDQIGARSLRPGPYRLVFSITDLASGRTGSIDAGIVVPAILTDRPALSQVELASEVKPDPAEKRFRKGALRVLPCPTRVFGDGSTIYYYVELYGLRDPAGKRLKISYGSDSDSAVVVVANEPLDSAGVQAVRTGGFRVDDMPDGGYQLWIQLLGDRGRLLASSSAGFGVKRDPLAAMPGAGRIIDEQEALQKQGGEYFDRIEYLASSRKMDEYRKLDSLGRREFLRQFWAGRDPNPKTPENEALSEHVRRYRYVNANFGENIRKGKEGSQTDRGRVYIKLGEPEEIEAKPMQSNSKPVVIWRYPGGKKVIFVDLSGFGRYVIVYTNVAGERSDPNHTSILSKELMDAEGIEY